jgi:hypothetical protein
MGERRAVAGIGGAAEQIAPVGDLLAERREGPSDRERLRQAPDIVPVQAERGGGRFAVVQAEIRGERLGHELARGNDDRRGREPDRNRLPPGFRPPEPDRGPASLAQPDRDDAEHDEDRHLVGHDVKDVVTDDDGGADGELDQRQRAIRWRKLGVRHRSRPFMGAYNIGPSGQAQQLANRTSKQNRHHPVALFRAIRVIQFSSCCQIGSPGPLRAGR